ncbi:MAG: hypothetical protein ACD_12C00462G0002 [uncultured bacterium]|nr:MAG: hypothetical protein ACD_12C00462G0002 [uncultured bacterium]
MDFGEALKMLADKAGVKLERVQYDSTQGAKKDRIYQMNHLVSEYYHYLLLNHQIGKEALDYILKRELNRKTLETFKIGYSPNSWESIFRFLKKKGFTPQEMVEAGLVIKNPQRDSYYDRFRGRLMFTLKNHRGQVVGFAGRKIFADDKDNEAKYINTSETLVYTKGNILYGLDITKEAIRKEGKAIVVEGEIDALSSFQAGVSNVVAIKGSALTQEQLELLKRYCDTLLISLDADLAGDLAARRGIELAEKLGFSLKVVVLSKGKDPDECIREGVQYWKESIKKAVPIYDFYINKALEKYDVTQADGKKAIGKEVLPILVKIENLIVKDHYLKILSEKLNVSVELLLKEMEIFEKALKVNSLTTNQVVQIGERPREVVLEEHLLSLLLQSLNPGKYEQELSLLKNYYQNELLKKILVNLTNFLTQQKNWDIKKFAKISPIEFVSTIDRLFLQDLKIETEEEKDNDFRRTTREIKINGLKNKLQKIGKEIEKATEEKMIKKLTLEFEKTTTEMKEWSR